MLTVADARARILDHFQPLPAERLPLDQAHRRVLAEDVIASIDLPAFANSAMDGYAVRLADTRGATREAPITLPVSGEIPAGAPPPPPLAAGAAMRIMTGAPLPAGADSVVPVEETDDYPTSEGRAPERITIFTAPSPAAHIRPAGQDVRAGTVVLKAGAELGPAAIGVLAALGCAAVPVHRRPVVAILSTGDELVSVDQAPAPGQLRDTNSYALAAAAELIGARPLRLGIARDQLPDVRAKLAEAVAAGADVILSSAGVSVGAYDVVKAAVQSDGALDFWRVRMRPGKPLAFGQVSGIPFIGLPGNPVSALVGFEVFVRPTILKLAGRRQWDPPAVRATLLEAVHSDGRESYLRARLERRGGELAARLTGDQGSNLITSLVRANGLVIVPEGVTELPVGASVDVWLLNSPGIAANS